jgi:echinoderm microtubule-associated protein-like 6
LCAADDRGLVRLLNYPVVVSDAPSRGYVGHSAHVTGVRFSEGCCSDHLHSGEGSSMGLSWVATCGGGDRAVFQFRLEEIIETVAPAVKEPEPVWGPLDASGKVFGWTKHSVRCTTGSEQGDSNDPVKVSRDLRKVEAEAAHVQEVNGDEGEASDDEGGWGNLGA